MLSRSFYWKVLALQGFPLKLRDILFLGIRLIIPNFRITRLGQRQEIDLALLTPEELSSLRLPDWLKPESLRICCLKMFPACSRMTRGGRLLSSSPRWMSWGIMSSGQCLTAPISTSPNQGEGCSLSDILIPDAPEKYFLSSEMTQKLLYKSSEGRRAPGSTTPAG